MEKSVFEQMGVTYKQVRDYLLPDIPVAPQTEKSIGVWGCEASQPPEKNKQSAFQPVGHQRHDE